MREIKGSGTRRARSLRIQSVSDNRFLFRGDLAQTPIPEMLQTVHHYRVPGVLSAVHEGIEKKIFIWNGDVIFATSGDRVDSLGDYLLLKKRITQEQFDQSVEILLSSDGQRRHGAVLVSMGVLTPRELFEIVGEQVRSILFSLFEWNQGEVTFQVGQYKTDELIQLHIPARRAILEGVKAMHDARRLVGLLGPSWTIFDPTFVGMEISDVALEPGELKMLQQIDGAKTLRELIVLGPGDASSNAKLMYAFFALKLVSRRKTVSKSIKKLQWKTDGGGFANGG